MRRLRRLADTRRLLLLLRLLLLRPVLLRRLLLWCALMESVERARVRLSRRSRALADPRARRGAQQGRGREHAHVIGKSRMPMAVPTPLLIASFECRPR